MLSILFAVAFAAVAGAQSDATLRLDGGGSFAPASYLLRLMQTEIEAQAKVPFHGTYRTTGTIEAQAEFGQYEKMYQSDTHFKVGDGPLPFDQWSALSTGAGLKNTSGVMQIPFAVNAIGLFYNQQVPVPTMLLSSCLIAQLYSGKLEMWSDPLLAAANNWDPNLPILNLPVVAYAYGVPHSNTLALSTYLNKACPAEWGVGAGASLNFSSRVTTTYSGRPIMTAEEMATAVANTPQSIGFFQSNLQSLSDKLQEARLANKAGTILTSMEASLPLTIAELVKAKKTPLTAAAFNTDRSTMDVYDLDGSQSWPMVELLYFYVYKDLTPYGSAGTLIKLFMKLIVLSDKGQATLSTFGLAPLPQSLLLLSRDAVDLLINQSGLSAWSIEKADAYTVSGDDPFTLSANRQLASDDTAQMRDDITSLTQGLALSLPVSVRGAGTTDTSALLTQALEDLSSQSTVPVRFLYENLMYPPQSALAAYTSLLPHNTTSQPRAHFLVSDLPLSSTQRQELGTNGVQALQMPFLVRPVSLLYVGPSQLMLSPCTVDKLLSGGITMWNDGSILADNPSVTDLPFKRLQILFGEDGSADVRAMRQYAQLACKTSTVRGSTLLVTADGHESVRGCPECAAALLATESTYGSIMIASPSYAADKDNLKEMALVARSGSPVHSQQIPSAAYSGLLDAIIGSMNASTINGLSSLLTCSHAPNDVTGDWSFFNMIYCDEGGRSNTPESMYPVVRADFLILGADLRGAASVGAATSGMVRYLMTLWQRSSALQAMAPSLNPLGSVASEMATSHLVGGLRLLDNLAAWEVVGSADLLSDASMPAFVSSYTVPARASVASNIDQVDLLATISLLTQRMDKMAGDHDKVNTTYQIAIAALVLSLVLPTIALLVWLARGRGVGAVLKAPSGSAGCFSVQDNEKYRPMEEGGRVNDITSSTPGTGNHI